jgi:ABC-type nitrate/sulfonate/bicarbonate transport system permease component
MKIKLFISMQATKAQIFKKVIFPSSLPAFFSGLRIAAAYSILGAVVSEWIGSERGLGILLTRSSKSYLTDRVFAIVIIISLLSILAIKIVEAAARFTIPWYYQNIQTLNDEI